MSDTASLQRQMLRHLVATILYRYRVAVENAPSSFGDFRAAADANTPGAILAHMTYLMEWSAGLFRGESGRPELTVLPWLPAQHRFEVAVDELDRAILAADLSTVKWEMLLQGPLTDTLTHIGQITMLRRLAGAPVTGGGYFRAPIFPPER